MDTQAIVNHCIVVLLALKGAVTDAHNIQVRTLEELAQEQTNVTNLHQNLNNQNLANLALAQNITITSTPTTEPVLSTVPYPALSIASQITKPKSIPDHPKFNENCTMLRMFVA